ncbi:carboxymuconolactone decarboxylase family protein [Nocardia sp. NPDC051787]|uniref:carboxymuconolactone decarboxylase family protein n=1 Tax=Nocardia sp. NPDC051787 TaxID=3155415 RepID=UPI0034284D4E
MPPVPMADPEFDRWTATQESDRWRNPLLTHRERALLCLAVDVLQQTLGAPMRAHIDTALSAGVQPGTVRALLLLMSELGMGKV